MFLASKSFILSQCVGSRAIFTTAICQRMSFSQQPIFKALEELKDIVITPDQPDEYKEAVKIYNPSYSNEHPAFVAVPKNVSDIQRCMRVALACEVPAVAIKSGGHSFAGYSTTDQNGFVVSMKNLASVTLKDGAVTVGAGANWGDVYKALENTNYVAVGGCVPAVGIGGYILGGGYSMLSRAYGGLACDMAEEFTMVTADGDQVVKVSKDKNKDLFWALKGGGGGNFGVLVDVTLKLSPRPKQFIWTNMRYDGAESTELVLNELGSQLLQLPKEMNLDFAIHGYFGKKTLTLDAVYSDHHADKVEVVIKNLHPGQRSTKTYESYLKFVREYSQRHGFVHYEVEPIYVKGAMIQSIPPEMAKYFSDLEIPAECLLEFVHMGGDIQQYPSTSTAFPYRTAEYSFYTYGRFHNNASRSEVYEFATSTYRDIKKFGCTLGSYVNYMDRHLINWPQELYGVNYPRLCEIKKKWNPLGKGPLHFEQEIGSTWEPE
jgi:UDP-N-acetylenolpyruvoylglucosamine reductase